MYQGPGWVRILTKVEVEILGTHSLKGIVSRDWGELQMIPVDSLQVFSIAGSYFTFFKQLFHV